MAVFICMYQSASREEGLNFANICKANVIGLMLFTLILFGGRSFIVHLGYFSTRMLLVFFVLNILLLAGERLAIRLFLRSLRTNGYNQKHVLLIGYTVRQKVLLTV